MIRADLFVTQTSHIWYANMKAEQKMIHIKSQLGISVESTGTGTERPAGGVTSKHMPQMDVTVVMHVSALDNIIQISIVTAHRDGAHLC